MRRVLMVALLSSTVHAADAPVPSPPPALAETSQGVIAYPASFFASMGLDTAYDMVLRIPGFSFDDGSSARGFAGAAGNVLIDGQRPASKTDDLISVLKRIPIAQVERIDLIRGGAPGIDMQGKTIVVNVIRGKGQGFQGVVAVGGYKPEGVPFDPQARLEGTWHDGDRVLEGSLFLARYHDEGQGSGPHEILGPGGQRLDFSRMINSAVSWQYTATAAYETPLFGGKFRMNLLLEDQPYDKVNIDNFQVAGREIEREPQDQSDAELGQHYQRDLTDALSFEILGLEHLNETKITSIFDTVPGNQDFRSDNHGGEVTGRGILHWRPSGSLAVDAGGEFAYNWLNTNTLFSDNGTSIPVPAGDVFVREKRGEAFATATWKPSPVLAIEAGLRVERSTISSSGDVVLSKTLAYPKPRLAVTWSPDAEDQLRARVEREVGQLDFNDFAANAALNSSGVAAGNPNLSPQRDWAFEIAYDRYFWTDGVVSLTLRHLALQDVIDRVPVFAPSGVFDEPGNIGGGRENDFVVSFNLPLDHLGLAGATIHGLGTWRVSQVTDPTTGKPRAISGQHPLDAELHFNQDLPELKLNWGIDVYFGYLERYYRFNEIDSTYTATTNRLFVEYKARPNLALRFEVYQPRLATDITRRVFDGPRDTDPLQFSDLERRKFGALSFIRIRKTFD